jgi:hypothetical protein
MTARAPDRTVRLRLTCEAAPLDDGIVFGLQDKDGRLALGTRMPDGAVRFETEVRSVTRPDGTIGLRGPIVHGPPAAPFLYLSCRPSNPPGAPWLFRLKVPLRDIDPDAAAMEARVRASRGGTVGLLGQGWTRLAAE